jgi:hypothetical protein
MVINFLSSFTQRGLMLQLISHHLLPAGVAFIMFPKLCLLKSMYMTKEIFIEALAFCGLKVEKERETEKIVFFCVRKMCEPKQDPAPRGLSKDPPPIVANNRKFNDFGVSFQYTNFINATTS